MGRTGTTARKSRAANKTAKTARIIKVQRTRRQYETLEKDAARDPRFTMEMLGLWTKLMMKPPDWLIIFRALAGEFKCSEKKIRSVFNQLQDAGYALRRRVRDRKSMAVKEWQFWVFETPIECALARQDAGTMFDLFDYPRFSRNEPDGRNPPSGFPTMWDVHHVGSPHGGKGPATELTTYGTPDLTERTTNEETGEATVQPNNPPADGAPTVVGVLAEPVTSIAPSSNQVSSLVAAPDSFVVAEAGEVGKTEDPVLLLVAAGFDADDAGRLVNRCRPDGARVRLILSHAISRPPSKQRGFIVSAIRLGWQLEPLDLRSAGLRAIDDAARQLREQARESDQLRHDEALAQEKTEIDAALSLISDEDWHAHVAALLPTLGAVSRAKALKGQSRQSPLIRAQVFARLRDKRVPA